MAKASTAVVVAIEGKPCRKATAIAVVAWVSEGNSQSLVAADKAVAIIAEQGILAS